MVVKNGFTKTGKALTARSIHLLWNGWTTAALPAGGNVNNRCFHTDCESIVN